MARYTIQAPDGHTVTMEGPDGASHDDVIAQAQKLYQPPPTDTGVRMGSAPVAIDQSKWATKPAEKPSIFQRVMNTIGGLWDPNNGPGDPATRTVDYLGNLAGQTTQAWHDAATGHYNIQTPVNMIPIAGPMLSGLTNQVATPGQRVEGLTGLAMMAAPMLHVPMPGLEELPGGTAGTSFGPEGLAYTVERAKAAPGKVVAVTKAAARGAKQGAMEPTPYLGHKLGLIFGESKAPASVVHGVRGAALGEAAALGNPAGAAVGGALGAAYPAVRGAIREVKAALKGVEPVVPEEIPGTNNPSSWTAPDTATPGYQPPVGGDLPQAPAPPVAPLDIPGTNSAAAKAPVALVDVPTVPVGGELPQPPVARTFNRNAPLQDLGTTSTANPTEVASSGTVPPVPPGGYQITPIPRPEPKTGRAAVTPIAAQPAGSPVVAKIATTPAAVQTSVLPTVISGSQAESMLQKSHDSGAKITNLSGPGENDPLHYTFESGGKTTELKEQPDGSVHVTESSGMQPIATAAASQTATLPDLAQATTLPDKSTGKESGPVQNIDDFSEMARKAGVSEDHIPGGKRGGVILGNLSTSKYGALVDFARKNNITGPVSEVEYNALAKKLNASGEINPATGNPFALKKAGSDFRKGGAGKSAADTVALFNKLLRGETPVEPDGGISPIDAPAPVQPPTLEQQLKASADAANAKKAKAAPPATPTPAPTAAAPEANPLPTEPAPVAKQTTSEPVPSAPVEPRDVRFDDNGDPILKPGEIQERVSVGLDPGKGAEERLKKDYNISSIPSTAADFGIRQIATHTGVGIVGVNTGKGAYLTDTEPSIHLEVVGTPEAIRNFRDAVGYAMGQTEVIGTTPNPKGNAYAFNVWQDVGQHLARDTERESFFHALRHELGPKAALVEGFQPYRTPDGQPGLRFLKFDGHMTPEDVNTIKEAIDRVIVEKGYSTKSGHTPIDLQSSYNDWEKNPNGEEYTHRLNDTGGGLKAWLDGEYRRAFGKRLKEVQPR